MSTLKERYGTLALAVLFEGGLIGAAWALGWLLGRPVFHTWHWSWWGGAVGVAATLPLLLVIAVLLRLRTPAVRRLERFFDEVVRPAFGECSWPELAVLSLVAGLGEELLFREVIQGALAERWGDVAALVAASLLFGLLHPITRLYVGLATLFGAYLGLCWLLTGNVLVVVVAHALYDFVVLLYLLRSASPSNSAGKTGEE